MAFKLPTPDPLKKNDKSGAGPAASGKAGSNKPAKKGGFSFAGLFGGKKKQLSPLTSSGKAMPVGSRGTPSAQAASSGFGATGDQTQKIAAAVAANKVTKTKKLAAASGSPSSAIDRLKSSCPFCYSFSVSSCCWPLPPRF